MIAERAVETKENIEERPGGGGPHCSGVPGRRGGGGGEVGSEGNSPHGRPMIYLLVWKRPSSQQCGKPTPPPPPLPWPSSEDCSRGKGRGGRLRNTPTHTRQRTAKLTGRTAGGAGQSRRSLARSVGELPPLLWGEGNGMKEKKKTKKKN